MRYNFDRPPGISHNSTVWPVNAEHAALGFRESMFSAGFIFGATRLSVL